MFLNLLIFIVISINTFLGILVFFNKRHARESQLYGVFVLVMNLWILSNYFENEANYFNIHGLEIFLRLDFFFAIWVFYFWFMFCSAFTKSLLTQGKYFWFKVFILLFSSILSALSFHQRLIVHSISFFDNIIHFENGQIFPLYVFWLVFLSIGGLAILFRSRQSMSKNSIEYRQINFIFLGFLISAVIALIINVFLQPFFNIPLELSRGALYGMIFLVLFPAYAILRHNLFNISVITTEIFVVGMELLLLIPVFQFENVRIDPARYFLNVVTFVLAIIFGYLIIKSVKKEIQRREEITNLAHSLEKANLRLQELDRQKTEFISIASHQLRTPLSIITGYIELIKDGAFGKPTIQMTKVLDDMDESNEHLVKLVDEFLDITRIEQGRVKYTFADSDINSLISNIVKEMAEHADKKNLTLVWKPNQALKKVSIDEEKIHHVVFNFLDNAIKYSDQGEIKIAVEKDGEGVNVKVRDNGVGFGAEDEANFFQKFYRGKNVKNTNVNGTGLGLFVCRKFIEAHSGRIWAKSEGLGKGSEFGFWVPMKNVNKY